MNKKDIDMLELMRESLLKANKDLGFLKEQTAPASADSAFSEEFDKKKHMPAFQIRPKSWGIKGTVDSDQVDAVISNLVAGAPEKGVDRFKIALKNLNTALGAKLSDKGKGMIEPVERGSKSNLNSIVSGLMVKNTINAIINETNAQAAGRIFESFVARMMGGITSVGKAEPIEDIVDAQGNYISLKTIVGATGVKGSKGGLARGILESGKVIYVICVKDKESNPFKMSTFSFEVDKSNYFKVITGLKSPTKEDIKKQAAIIMRGLNVQKRKEGEPAEAEPEAETAPDTEMLREADTVTAPEFERVSPTNQIEKLLMAYYGTDTLAKAVDEFEQDAEDALKSTKDITDTETELFNALMGVEFSVSKANFAQDLLKKIIVMSFKGKVKKNPNIDPSYAKEAFKKMLTLFPDALKRYGELDSLYPIYAKEFGEQKVKNLLAAKNEIKTLTGIKQKQAQERFKGARGSTENFEGTEQKIIARITQDYGNLRRKLGEFMAIIAQLETELRKIVPRRSEAGQETPATVSARTREYSSTEEATTAQQEIDNFFSTLEASISDTLEQIAEAKLPDTQFMISLSLVKDLVPIDDSYETIIISKDSLFNAAQDNAKKFEEWAEPIYRGMHYLTQGINQYFIEDRVVGLDVASKGAEEAKAKISSIKSTGKAASALEENKQTIKKSALDDILSDLTGLEH